MRRSGAFGRPITKSAFAWDVTIVAFLLAIPCYTMYKAHQTQKRANERRMRDLESFDDVDFKRRVAIVTRDFMDDEAVDVLPEK